MTIATTSSVTISGNGLHYPWGIAFDTSGRLWVANSGDDTVREYLANGTPLRIVSTDYLPAGVAADQLGNLWVANYFGTSVQKISSTSGTVIQTLSAGVPSLPTGIAIDSSGNLWLSSRDSSGDIWTNSGGAGFVVAFHAGGGGENFDLEFDSNGHLWVSDYYQNAISEFDVAGNLIQTFSTGFSYPTALAFDRSGNLWVANDGTNSVKAISPVTGALIQEISGTFSPWGLAFDASGDLWVSSYLGSEIYEFLNISPTPSGGNTINVGGQLLTQQTVSGNSTITSGTSSVITYGNIQAKGGAAQNNPLSTQNTSETTAGAVVTLPTLMAVKTQKIKGLLSAVTTEMAEAMTRGVSGSATDSTKIAGSSMIAPPDSNLAVESIAPPSDVPMESIAYPVYGYNYFYLSDFQGSSNFRVTSTSGNLVTTNLLELINNNGGNQNVDIAGYQGIVVATPGVNVTGLTVNNYLGTFGGGSYTFGAGNQKLFLMGPNSNITGGGGIDTVRFLGVGQGGVNITQQGNEVQIWSDWLDTGSGVTYMHNVARAQFDDGSVAFDTGAGQNAGQVFRLYEAAFHRAGDQQGIGYWLNQIDNGTSLNTIANQFLSSQEFINLYGSSPSNNQFITALYNNVLGRAPDAAGLNYWLSTGLNKAQLLIEFAESPEGVAHVSGQMAQGVQYQQWVQ